MSERGWSVEDREDGFLWHAFHGSYESIGLMPTRTEARDAALEALEHLGNLSAQGPCLVCFRNPRRTRSSTCSERCANRLQWFLRRKFASLPVDDAEAVI